MLAKKDILHARQEVCRQDGAVQSVGPAYYQWFAGLSDDTLSKLQSDLLQ
jgi:hypothetical protein